MSKETDETEQAKCRKLCMNFTDPQLQKCYETSFAAVPDLPGEQRQVSALIAAHDLFRMLEGPHSSRVHEAIEHLLSPEMRPGLRHWYQRSEAENRPGGGALRDHLSQLTGEKLENRMESPHDPPSPRK